LRAENDRCYEGLAWTPTAPTRSARVLQADVHLRALREQGTGEIAGR